MPPARRPAAPAPAKAAPTKTRANALKKAPEEKTSAMKAVASQTAKVPKEAAVKVLSAKVLAAKASTAKPVGAKRPAHRPSRRSHIISSALSLFVRAPYDDVKVSDIAALADLTPAAVHYHFDGKEQILLEGMREFSEELLERARELVEAGAEVDTVISALITFVRSKRTAATVFYVTTAGLSLSFEAHRKLVRAELAELFSRAARNHVSRRPKAEVDVMGAALVSVLEVSAITTLKGDETARALGSRKLLEVVGAIAKRVVAE